MSWDNNYMKGLKSLDNKGEATVIIIASWLIIAGFLGLGLLVGSAMTRSSKTDLKDYKEIHSQIPDNYEDMTPSQKREFWKRMFDRPIHNGGEK